MVSVLLDRESRTNKHPPNSVALPEDNRSNLGLLNLLNQKFTAVVLCYL